MKFLRYLSAIVLVAFAVFSAASGQMKPVEFSRDSLPNGLQIIYSVDKSAPIVASMMYYKSGSSSEDPSKTGYAHFFEHLMFESTESIPRDSIMRYIQLAGGELNAFTSTDQTAFFIKVPANELKLPLFIESQRMRKLNVDDYGVETQRGVVLEELNMRVENRPYGSMHGKIREILFAGTPYSWTPIGSAKHIEKAKISDFKEFYDRNYRPNNAILVLSGDFDPNAAKRYVRSYFGSYPGNAAETALDSAGIDSVKKLFTIRPLAKDVRETIRDERAQLPGLFMAWQGPAEGSEDQYALELLFDVLGSGESSRLHRVLVEDENLAVQTGINLETMYYAGAITFYAIPRPGEDVEDIEKEFFDVVEDLVKKGLEKGEFQKAKNIKEYSIISSKKDALNKAIELAMNLHYYDDPEEINESFEKFSEIKEDDLIRVAKKYLLDQRKAVLVYVPAEKEDK